MLRSALTKAISDALDQLIAAGELPEGARVAVEVLDTRQPEHGDFACNLAMIAAKPAGMPPRAIAEKLQSRLSGHPLVQSIEVAGPGFMNFRLNRVNVARYVDTILEHGEELAKAQDKPEGFEPQFINVEFVSVNPNGPITIGSGRGAAFGDTLSRVLEAAGHRVDREYYINDGINSEQMRLFAESVKHYYREALDMPSTFPEKGYRGEYVFDVATRVREIHGDSMGDESAGWFQNVSQELMIERQRTDLERFGVIFKRWFSEQSLHDSGKVLTALDFLRSRGDADDRPVSNEIKREDGREELVQKEEMPGPLWLRSTKYGDEKDRVLTRSDGRPAYIAADVAYMKEKFDRGYDKLYLILGPDHHGYIGRMNAVCQALGHRPDEFEIIIYQIVRFLKEGKPAPMRKRDGNIYELRDLMNEVGTDVTRFFYLMRSHDTHMDFDIDLATKQSDENPVFYVQYAHARICSVLRKAEESGFSVPGVGEADTSLLNDPRETALLKKILDLPWETQRAAEDFGVHRLTTYAVELARTYHHFYDACRVIQPEAPDLTKARLALCAAARLALKSTFNLLGISAPERMDRA